MLNWPIIKSPTGAILINSTDSTLTTDSPAWIVIILTITNAVNFVLFDSQFVSGATEGLLSVYWDTNSIGSIDERVTPTGLRRYAYVLPENISSGLRVLGFRLDTYTNVLSSVTVTNVALGFAGMKEPFSLSFTVFEQTDCQYYSSQDLRASTI